MKLRDSLTLHLMIQPRFTLSTVLNSAILKLTRWAMKTATCMFHFKESKF